MQLEHSFDVPVPVPQAWDTLLDIENVAPCLPGATIDSVDGDTFSGTVKVKVGPITVAYSGTASFTEKDVDDRRAVLQAKGRETRGSGTAAATVTAQLSAAGDGTHVAVSTDLAITGRPAQFGRGVMSDVGAKLLGQFSDCLATKLAAGSADDQAGTAPETGAAPAAASVSEAGESPGEMQSAPARSGSGGSTDRPTPEAIDLVSAAGGSVVRRIVIPVLIVIAVVVILFWLL